MKIEILYGELANLLGEHGSQQLLEKSFGGENLVRTAFPALPAFFEGGIDLVYMGPMTEGTQRLVLELWRGHGDRFRESIQKGTVFFFAGNALDLVGRSIRYQEQDTVEALGLYPFDTLCRRYDRQNEVLLASFNETPILGFRSQFTSHTGDASAFPFLQVEQGSGMNPAIRTEGIRDKNFFATSLLGPFLILNPAFTSWLFKKIGFSGALPFENELIAAQAIRLADFSRSFGRKRRLSPLIRTYLEKESQLLELAGSGGKKEAE